MSVSAVGRRSWLPFWEGTLCLIVDPPVQSSPSPFFFSSVQYSTSSPIRVPLILLLLLLESGVSGTVLIWLRIA